MKQWELRGVTVDRRGLPMDLVSVPRKRRAEPAPNTRDRGSRPRPAEEFDDVPTSER